ncbi:hypothetical protein GCM10023153_01970 [Ornithinibacter aureus]|uniref:Uncharacterized protein n=1 Tax=Ornithinibacter aureus TaxID=622664 RepID=A0ABP8JA44_9MICO
MRHVGQNPSVRPGCPSRERPTGDPHEGQVRRSSGTIGFSSTALAASTAATGGIVVSPAPRRAPRRRVDEVPTLRVTELPPAPARAEPRAVDARRFDARDTVDGLWATPAGAVAVDAAPAGGAFEVGAALEVGAAGEPQTSQ